MNIGKPLVKNVPQYAAEYPYIVVRKVENERLEFYGAYKESREAFTVSKNIKGIVLDTWENERQ